jgi:predicted outer membrane repeat protein
MCCAQACIFAPKAYSAALTLCNAVCAYVLTYLIDNLQSSFTDNKALNGNGGALEVDSSAYSTLPHTETTAALNSVIVTDTTFTANAAYGIEAAGGAVSLAVYAAAAFERCTFTNNSAAASGGAIVSETSAVAVVSDCIFDSNTAGTVGGSLLLSLAEHVAPTVTNSSFTGSKSRCCFADGFGSTQQWRSTNSSCMDLDTRTAATAECCATGYYNDGTTCHVCNTLFGCDTVGTTVSSLHLLEGYWRSSVSTLTILECYRKTACKGGVALLSSDEYCSPGYAGPCKYSILSSFHNI